MHATFRFTNAECATGNFLGQIRVGGFKSIFCFADTDVRASVPNCD